MAQAQNSSNGEELMDHRDISIDNSVKWRDVPHIHGSKGLYMMTKPPLMRMSIARCLSTITSVDSAMVLKGVTKMILGPYRKGRLRQYSTVNSPILLNGTTVRNWEIITWSEINTDIPRIRWYFPQKENQTPLDYNSITEEEYAKMIFPLQMGISVVLYVHVPKHMSREKLRHEMAKILHRNRQVPTRTHLIR